MSGETLDKGEQMFFELTQQAQPIGVALLAALRDMQPKIPPPLVAAIACRYVGLYAAKVLLAGALDQSAKDAVVEAFESIDARLSISAMLANNVAIDDGLIADVLQHRDRSPQAPLPERTEDPTVFDIDSWEKT